MSANDQALAEAIISEQALADRAREIRGDVTDLTPGKFLELHPLLCEPIPPGFIQSVGVTKGKPYASTGISSVQVQIDRMNNVLTPLWWWYEEEFEDAGKVCKVTVYVGDRRNAPLVERSGRGGVDRGSTLGNVYKGSFTNAAKITLARVGPGHEIYLGAADLDPDTNAEVASAEPAAEQPSDPSKVGKDIAKKLVDRAWKVESAKENFQLAASHAADRDVGPVGKKNLAVDAVAALTFAQAESLERWVDKKEKEASDA